MTDIKKNTIQSSDQDINSHTPVMQQYLNIKRQYPEHLLLYRMGDFYEFFFEDAYQAVELLDIQLTKRGKAAGIDIPMAGIPAHALDSYLSKLIRQRVTAAICEQSGMDSSKLMKREVVRIVTAGTVTDEGLTNDSTLQYLTAISYTNKSGNKNLFGVVHFLSTDGIARVLPPMDEKELINELEKAKPVEIIMSDGSEISSNLSELKMPIFYKPKWLFDVDRAKKLLKKEVPHIDRQILNKKSISNEALAGLINYLNTTQINVSLPIAKIEEIALSNYLSLDRTTRRNLEIEVNLRGGIENTLFSLINKTQSNMGSRYLLQKIQQIPKDFNWIKLENEFVKELSCFENLNSLRVLIRHIGDGERLLSRLRYKTERPRELVRLKEALKTLPEIKKITSGFISELGKLCSDNIESFNAIYEALNLAIVDNPPQNIREGGVIKDGFDEELDKLRNMRYLADESILKFEQSEKERTQLNIKVGFQQAYGFYIDISRILLEKISNQVPSDYIRIQSLKNSERFSSPALKSFESEFLASQARALAKEKAIYQNILLSLQDVLNDLQATFFSIARVDVYSSFAYVATEKNWVLPTLDDSSTNIEIIAGRHPVVEDNIDDIFCPNDFRIKSGQPIHIITGPNMGGKSTFMRQNVLIILLAYIGSFIPAKSASIGRIDAIFTRIGASDDLASGQSTFMIEMLEAASILHQATSNSLVLMDEIGRGTNSNEGLAIAISIAEYLAQIKVKTLFATHYFEVTKLSKLYPSLIQNFHVTTSMHQGKLFFEHRLKSGSSNKSYAIDVANLAGLPKKVIGQAKFWLNNIQIRTHTELQGDLFDEYDEQQLDKSESDSDIDNGADMNLYLGKEEVNINQQSDHILNNKILADKHLIEYISSIDPDQLSPKDALEAIYEIKKLM